ncbi:MCE family protein [Nocardia terpenica]|uniref:Mammalian cell entry protein n=1 Tax=Nocardia terpenica TaxID=455432 RepID=A0A164IF40_9NOCA|nr:MCE family protein [Nocardia terpenica]KZM69386.1 mammalian cell entry protein [Nocardia terpenica]MBF6062327.1 MCE family protein [Nocardia terpenica]MBF6104415.1 MCE family protein [Nocardia terpenica]MBF6109729.1 MCE family protein [Nocardia terpenica]MBF6120035.1 MCE family protein [Nocardia terpenica]
MNGSRLLHIGIIGVVLAVTISLSALQFGRLPFVRSGAEFTAYFADAGGLVPGDPVQVAGVRSGRVEQVRLAGAKVRVRFSLDESIVLGRKTSAAIKTNTVLGRKSLEVTPAGDGVIRRDDPIPLERTTSPYSLNEVLGDLATTVHGLDTDQVDKTLDALSQAFADTPGPLRQALDGVTALSRSLNARDKALIDLLSHAQNVTKVLSDRANQIDALLVDGNNLLGELDARRAALSQLIVYVNGLAQQLTGFVNDNEAQLKPTLEKLNSVLALLQKNKDNIGRALQALGPFEAALGEQVGSGPYFQAYVSNATSKGLQILVDAMVWPEHVPDSLRNFFLEPAPPSIGPATQEPPR